MCCSNIEWIFTAIHTNTRLQNLRRAKAGQQLIVRGHLLNVFEKKRNQYVQVDGLITTEDGQELAQLRYIFAVFKQTNDFTTDTQPSLRFVHPCK